MNQSFLALGLCVAACGSDGEDGAGGSGGSSNQCEDHEPGTEFAPCESDADCYSGFCDETGNPGPYCWASSTALAEGRGIACSSNEECTVPAHAAERGVKGFCGGSNIAQNYCSFVCKPGADETSSSSTGAPSTTGGAE